jgi:16S rRNA (cytosine1402-N4)-methyltransferase
MMTVTDDVSPSTGEVPAVPHKRRVRYSGKHPRKFEEKYKEHDPQRYAETVAKVIASGKTPAGTHRPIMVTEILEVLSPKPGQVAVDCTLGYGGHTEKILAQLQPGGRLLGLDADPIELPRTEARLRAAGFGPETFSAAILPDCPKPWPKRALRERIASSPTSAFPPCNSTTRRAASR